VTDWDDFDYPEPELDGLPDKYEVEARERLEGFFEKHDDDVFFGNQLAVQNEKEFFHWVTHRALAELIGEGLLLTETRSLASGSELKLIWHRRHRYYKRDAARVAKLVEEYGSPNMCAAIGLHGEQMVLGGFARREFVMRGHHTRKYREGEWLKTQHNLDFIFERDGVAYGVEVKNTLSYMDREEFTTKIALAEHLEVVPGFAVRMLPKSWMKELIDHGGYGMILKYQLYPWTHGELAKRVAKELGLPVDSPRALADGTMDRFVTWHGKKR
jgi:hypothetical protein